MRRHSRVGDKYWLRSSYKFAYGVLGRSGIPRESVRDTTTNDSKGTVEAGPVVAVPPNMDLEFYIEVTGHYSSAYAAAKAISLRNKEDITLFDEQVATTAVEDTGSHVSQVLAETDLRRTCGNRWFSYGDYPKAGKAYAKGIEHAKNYLQGDSTAEGAKPEAKETSDEDTVENTEPEAEAEADDNASRYLSYVCPAASVMTTMTQ